jgi:tetratricopeptide (TPR) repeat protein
MSYKRQLAELHQQAVQEMNSGNLNEALNITRKIQSLGSDYYIAYTVSALLIDIGSALNDESLIIEAVDLLQKNFAAIIHEEKLAPSAYYNLANGFHGLFGAKRIKNPSYGYFEDTEINQAKELLRKALEQKIDNQHFVSEIYVNLGNCYDEVGRAVEAQECYDEALRVEPEHGMALGNKGQGLFHYAAWCDEHRGTFLIESYALLSKAIKKGVTPEAATTFAGYLNKIKQWAIDKQALEKPFDYSGYKINAETNFEQHLIEFCLEHKLYLNICNFCQKCDAAIGDTVIMRKMITKPDEDSFFVLSSYINHIKQDYVSARFLLVLSRYKGISLDFVDRNVRLIDTLDYTRHNIYIQLTKEAFKCFYNVLDKIACFINYYLKLGIPEFGVDFRRVWYSDWNTRNIRQAIRDNGNFGLNTLFDIHRDFESGPYATLRKSRNALTHRFLNVREKLEIENEENMTEKSLFEKTLQLGKIVRSAIIYLLFFVYWSEKKKERKTKGQIVSVRVNELPDNSKAGMTR